MMNQQYGAHEVMEMHEILTDTIDGINQFQLYQPYCQDPELQNIIQNQIRFMTNEYNEMINSLQAQNKTGAGVSYRTVRHATPTYGMNNTPSAEKPNQSTQQLNDHDISSGMLGCAKSSATMRMRAALECANPEWRNMMIQGAKNCADQAYETWNFMNKRGFYQVPTMPQNTTQNVINHYQPMTGRMTGGTTNAQQPIQ